MLQMYRVRGHALVQVARVGAEKNHVCIYISAGINHSTEKSRHKTQTGSQRGTAHPLNTQWPYVAAVRTRIYTLTEKCFYYSPVNYERDGIPILLSLCPVYRGISAAVYTVHQ